MQRSGLRPRSLPATLKRLMRAKGFAFVKTRAHPSSLPLPSKRLGRCGAPLNWRSPVQRVIIPVGARSISALALMLTHFQQFRNPAFGYVKEALVCTKPEVAGDDTHTLLEFITLCSKGFRSRSPSPKRSLWTLCSTHSRWEPWCQLWRRQRPSAAIARGRRTVAWRKPAPGGASVRSRSSGLSTGLLRAFPGRLREFDTAGI